MARKAKKKVAKSTVVSQPRKVRSRPVWAMLFFTLAALVAVGVFDYNTKQYNATDQVDPNLVGYFGSYVGFFGFHFLGVAVFLLPVFLFWFGLRLALQQDRGTRLTTALVSPLAIFCASGLMTMMRPGTSAEGSVFEAQLSNGFGGFVGEMLGPVLMEPYIGPFGTFLVLLMGFLISSLLVFTNNLSRLSDFLQEVFRDFMAKRGESKEARRARKAERAEARREAKEAKARAKAERKAAKEAAKQAATPDPEDSDASDGAEVDFEDDGRRPSLLRGVSAPPADAPPPPKPIAKKKLTPKMTAEPDPEPKKPALNPEAIKIISGEKTEKAAVASIPERRGDYVFPPLNLLAEAPDNDNASPEDHAGTMEALVRTLDRSGCQTVNPTQG